MRIAVIGSGIGGLAVSLLLSRDHEVHLLEKDRRFGGHSRTLEVADAGRQQPVDTGFIVFNRRNYPWLCRLFDWLQVPMEKSSMSFAVSIDNGWLEYGSSGLRAMLAQPGNLLRPGFWRMARDIRRFNRLAPAYLEDKRNLTLAEAILEMGLGDWFRDHYLLAMGSAIWSTPASRMLEFPARSFIRFFQNHGLLDTAEPLQWYTVTGGSRCYVSRILERLPPENLHHSTDAYLLSRSASGVVLKMGDQQQKFDQLILACHSDQALQFLGPLASAEERSVLGDISYQDNEVVLHQDASFMPRRRACWQSWVYLRENLKDGVPKLSMSYWMNKLQNFSTRLPVIVTLNPDRQPEPSLVLDRWITQHPQFDLHAMQAQNRLHTIQGHQGVWFCGAWTGYGFHEDGVRSAVHVASALGVDAKQMWNGK